MKKKTSKKASNPLKFLLAMVMFYGVLLVFFPSLFGHAFREFLKIFLRIIPLLFLVFAVMLITNYFIRPDKIKRHLGKDSGWRGYLYATIAGILISGPPYLLYPLLADLKKHGAKNSLLAVFLYNRNVKIPFIPVMVYYFGLSFTVVLSLLIIIFSFLNGRLVEIATKDA